MCTSIIASAEVGEGAVSRPAVGSVVIGFGDGVGVSVGVLVGSGKDVLGSVTCFRTIEYPASAVVSPITAMSKMTMGANPLWSFIIRILYIGIIRSQRNTRTVLQ